MTRWRMDTVPVLHDDVALAFKKCNQMQVALEKAVDKMLQLDAYIDGKRKSRPTIRGTVALCRAAMINADS
jgi:hypothetical protein